MDQQPDKPELFYDGDCALCCFFVSKLGHSADKLQLRNFRNSTLPKDLHAEECEKQIHLQDSQGEILKGVDALKKALDCTDRWSIFRKLLGIKVLKPLLQFSYDFVAKNRFLFGKKTN